MNRKDADVSEAEKRYAEMTRDECTSPAALVGAGVKRDTGKDPWHLLPTDAVRAIVRVLAFGANKYAERNWERGIAHSRTYAATLRHLTAWWEGENDDTETGLSHLAHAACEIAFALAFTLRGRVDLDDRPRVALAPRIDYGTCQTCQHARGVHLSEPGGREECIADDCPCGRFVPGADAGSFAPAVLRHAKYRDNTPCKQCGVERGHHSPQTHHFDPPCADDCPCRVG